MGPFLIVSLILLISGGIAFWGIRTFRRHAPRRVWRLLLVSHIVVGIGLGIWLGGAFEYQPSTRMRIIGLPLPLAVFIWEHDAWTDFVSPPFVTLFSFLANITIVTTTTTLPFFFVFLLVHRSRRDKPMTVSP